MKISKAVQKELGYIALGTAVMLVILILVLYIAGRPFPEAIYGALFGSAFAVVNFLAMGLTVQKAVSSDSKQAQYMVQLSYSLRMLAMIFVGWLGFSLPVFDGFAVIIPFFFPRITIFFMGFFRKDLKPEKQAEGE